jgi:DNA-binding NarL/FixJ family response regulator
MEKTQHLTDLFVYVCSRNPLTIWTVESLLIGNALNRRVSVWFPNEPDVAAQGIHILLIDAASITEWPEVARKWTSAGHKTILLVAECWGSGGAELRALHLGVHGIVHVSPEFVKQLLEAVKLVGDGQLFASRETLDQFYCGSRRFRPQGVAPVCLSFREEQVIDLLGNGFSNKRIAAVLEISERTAKFHVCNILSKMRITSRKQLIRAGQTTRIKSDSCQ